MSAVIQIAQGLGSATFPAPTQPGNIIVVGIVNNDNTTAVGGFTDDASGGSNLYTNNPSSHAAGTNTQTDIWYGYIGAAGGTAPTVPCQTVTANVVGTNPWMWIIEVASNFKALFLINPSDIYGNVTESGIGYPGASATPFLWADEGAVGGDVLALVVLGCGGEGGTATGVEATWTTVGTAQGGNWLAYKFFANGTDFFPHPQFTASASTDYCMSMTAFYALNSVTPGNIIVNKVTIPAGSPQSFTFTPSYGAPFVLTDGQSNNSGPLNNGTYSVVETPVLGWTTGTSRDPSTIVVDSGTTATVTFTNTRLPTCAPLALSGKPVNGVYVSDLSLFIMPATALYNDLIPNSDINFSETALQGRREIILDFKGSDGLWMRDLGTIFTWATKVKTVLRVWQPSIVPTDGEIYDRLQFHALKSSLGMVGYAHAREMNIAHISTADLTLELEFDQWPTITLTIPNSGGIQTKTKVTLPPNKWKLIEVVITSTAPFKIFGADLELKCKQWGSTESYQVLRPVVT